MSFYFRIGTWAQKTPCLQMQFTPQMWDSWLFSVATARVITIKSKLQGHKTPPCKKAERLKATKPTGHPRKTAGDTKSFHYYALK